MCVTPRDEKSIKYEITISHLYASGISFKILGQSLQGLPPFLADSLYIIPYMKIKVNCFFTLFKTFFKLFLKSGIALKKVGKD